VPHIRRQVGGSRGRIEGWVVGLGYSLDTVGPVVYQKSSHMAPNHTTRQSRPSGNNHGQLGAASHQCNLIKPTNLCSSVSELFRAMKKPSGKADLAVYGYPVVVSG